MAAPLLAALLLCSTGSGAAPPAGECVVDTSKVAVERFLGFGAEWDPNFWADHNQALGVTEQDWQRVVGRIRWMKLPVVRMMIQARWCTAGDGTFRWDSPGMKSLCRHLDVCQKLGITVFLTDWGVATWCKVPGFSGNDDPKYAEAIGTYLDHLIRAKGYSCIRYFILVNEPNYEGGGWDRWKKGVGNVARVLAACKLPVGFVGTDAAHDDAWHRRGVDQLASAFSVWDIHRYAPQAEVLKGGLEAYLRKQWHYARTNDPGAADKLFMVGEAGMREGMVGAHSNTNIDSYRYGVFMADYAVQAARAGTAAVLAWMLDDSSHKGFRWGLWKNKTADFALRPWFIPWSLLVRTVRPGSTIFRAPQPGPQFRVLAARLPREKGAPQHGWTFCLVNRGKEEGDVTLRVPDAGTVSLHRYVYSRAKAPRDADGFPVPVATEQADLGRGHPAACPPQAVVFFTTVAP